MRVADYIARMMHANSGVGPTEGFDALQIFNEALRELFDFHDWSWRKRPPALVDLVADQEYAALPSDFGYGSLLGVEAVHDGAMGVVKTDLAALTRLRGSPMDDTAVTYVALSWPSQTAATSGPGPARLEVYPTPAENVTGAFRVIYKAGPIDCTNTDSVPNIPASYEAALSMLCRGLVKRYERNDDREYVAALMRLEQLKATDGMQEQDLGYITGGAVSLADHTGDYRPFNNSDIPNH
jgi:hypothetical protein